MITHVTKELAIKAVLMGACSMPTIGQEVAQLSTGELIWAEDHQIAKAAEGELPIWVRSGYGDGYGYGYGSGSGSGDGYGYGYGYGSGSGSGYGDGYGYSSGYGDGYGYGSGDGSGDGDGSGITKVMNLLRTK